MKTKLLNACIITFIMLINQNMYAQSTTANNLTGGGKFLGYSGAQNLEFRTNNITRMQLMQTGNSTINGSVINRSGFLGLSQDPTFFTGGVASPFSLLHLNGDNGGQAPQQAGYRNWMRHGLLFTHNRDLMFVGIRSNAQDVSDAVIAWADNGSTPPTLGIGPDILRFLHTSGTSGETEIARMLPEGRMGVGTQWTNTFLPQRTLDVILQQDGTTPQSAPQFRIT